MDADPIKACFDEAKGKVQDKLLRSPKKSLNKYGMTVQPQKYFAHTTRRS